MARRKIQYSSKLQTRKSVVTAPRFILKVGRNEVCPCGSGKKYKDCHEKDGDNFLQKMAMLKEKERIKNKKAELKEEGVPFWKRWITRV